MAIYKLTRKILFLNQYASPEGGIVEDRAIAKILQYVKVKTDLKNLLFSAN